MTYELVREGERLLQESIYIGRWDRRYLFRILAHLAEMFAAGLSRHASYSELVVLAIELMVAQAREPYWESEEEEE